MSKDYRGVSYKSDIFKYTAIVTHQGKTYRCGFFDTPKEAAVARDTKIIENGLNVPLQVLKPLNKKRKNGK